MFSDKELHDLVGIPFVDYGRTPEGFDCWGLVMYIYATKGIEIPDYGVSAGKHGSVVVGDVVEQKKRSWAPVKPNQLIPLDIMTFRIDPDAPEFTTHIGTYVGGGLFIHCLRKTGVILSRRDDLYWRTRISGCYSWPSARE